MKTNPITLRINGRSRSDRIELQRIQKGQYQIKSCSVLNSEYTDLGYYGWNEFFENQDTVSDVYSASNGTVSTNLLFTASVPECEKPEKQIRVRFTSEFIEAPNITAIKRALRFVAVVSILRNSL